MNLALSPTFRSLRVSLSDQCDLACQYCVDPNQPKAHKLPLAPEQLAQLAQLLLRNLPITRLKLTGGEPLLGNRLQLFLEALGPQPSLGLSLTTNGQQLAQKIPLLQSFGLKKINVSIDSLDTDCFYKLTKGSLASTLAGIEQAHKEGFNLKLNMVPLRGINDAECLDLFEFASARGMVVRYIELMEMGHLWGKSFEQRLFDRKAILAQIGQRYEVKTHPRAAHRTAQLFQVENKGSFGIIANHSTPFCSDCDRLRLSSTGELFGCLSSQTFYPLKPLLKLDRAEADRQLAPLLQAAFKTKQPSRFVGSPVEMKAIGG